MGTALRLVLLAALAFALASRALGAEVEVAAGAEPSRLGFDLAVAAGGGWDSNLSRSAGAGEQGASFGTGRAGAGATLRLTEDDELGLDLGWEGTLYAGRLGDLSEHSPSAALGWLHLLGERTALRLSLLGGLRLSSEAARSGWEAAATASLRHRLGSRLSLRFAATGHLRGAGDPAYAGDGLRGRAAVEVDLWERAFVAFGYAADLGHDTFYAAAAPAATPATAAYGPGSGQGGGGPQTGAFHTPLVPYRDGRLAHVLSADLTQHLAGGLFLQAGYSYSAVRGGSASYDAHAVTAEVGWRR